MNVYTKIAAKSVIFSILIAAYCTADANEYSFSTCSDEPSSQGKRHSILDKALEKYISSGMVKDVAFPDFNETVYLGRLKCYMEFYNATIVGIHFIERVGCNYLEAKLHKNMQIQVGLKLQGLSASISFRKKRSRRYTKALVKIFLPEFLLFAEIQEVGEMLKLARLDISDIEKLKIQFRFLTGMLKIINEKKKLQAYVNKRINKQLHVEIPRAMEGLLKELGHRHTEECVGCTMFDIVLSNGLRKFGLDPIALPKITQQLLGRLVHVKVTNGKIGGLTRLRQSGDIVTRIDERGAHAFVDMTSHNLSVTFDVYVTTSLTNYTATVSVSISARVILHIEERNTALVLEKLVITTEAVHVSVTPVGVVSSVVTFFLPPEFIADLIKENIEQLTRSTIQSGLDKLRTFAYGGATAE